ncbi:MAG: hypothetical protein JW904_05790 [Spirochaetales bacterium]|nr:hypothetical protein [Spirochaetales bacterium]
MDNNSLSKNASVCYLLDSRGTPIACSNQNDPDSFMGKNYSFRLYFAEAVGSCPSV